MNSYMNITVRVMTKQAQLMLANLDRQLTTTSRIASSSSFGGAGAMAASRNFRTLGNSMQWAGYQLLHAFTIPLALAGGAAIKYELDNQRAFANVKKVYGDAALTAQNHGRTVRNELAALRKEFVALSDVYGVSQTDVINIAEAWAAAGVSGAALGKSVENTLKTMVIGDLQASAATKALIAIQAQYGASTKEMTRILQALNVVENITGATMGDLIEGFSRSASVAAAAGVDYKHLAAMIAALVPSQGTATRAGNALKTIITDLLAPTAKAAEVLKEMGINIDDASWRSLTASERLELLSQKFKKLDGNQKVAASNYIAGKYQISRFDQVMADLGKSFDKQGKYLGDNSKKLGYYGKALSSTRSAAQNAKIAQQELNTVLTSNPQKLRQVWTILKNEAADAVRGLIPFLIQFVTVIAGAVHWFSNLNPVIQRWVAILILALALLGPILLYVAAISKLIHVLGTVFRTAGRFVGWFFGLFSAEKRTISGLQAQIASLRAELETLSATPTIEKLNAELEILQAQLAAVNGEAVATSAGIAESSTAATTVVVRNNEAAAASYAKAFYESAAASQAANAVRIRNEAAWLAAASKASTGSAEVYAMSSAAIVQDSEVSAAATVAVWEAGAAGIVATWITATEQIISLTAMRARAEIMAAEAAAAGWVAAFATIAAAAAAAAAYQMEATIAELAAMRATMGMIDLTATHWVAAGLLEAASVDQVTAQLIIQMEVLRALQAQALLTSRTMIEANSAAAASTALVPVGGVARTGTAVEKYGAGATVGAAEGMRAANGKLYAETRAATTKTEGIFARSIGKIGGFFKSGFSKIAAFIDMIFLGIPSMVGRLLLAPFTALAAALSIPVGVVIAIILALVAIFLIFRHQITDAAKWVAARVVDMAKWIWGALKSIGGFFADLARTVWEALSALPRAVVEIFKAVVHVIAEAAKQIYELFSYLNPFAHHSPSLVENVNRGMDVIARRFAGIKGSVSDSMTSAYADIKRFSSAVAGLIKTDQALKEASDIKLLSKFAPGGVGAYKVLAGDLHVLTDEYNKLSAAVQRQQVIVDAQQATVDKLNNKLDDESTKLQRLQTIQQAASDALDKSKQKLQDYASAPIKGMKAMGDQIFANSILEKKLQLQMLKMEDVIGPIDKVQSKMDALAGQIEKLKGEQSALRSGGAGSDILDAYDKQIGVLEGQQGAIQKSVDNYQKLQDALDAIQHKGRELDLEQSLKFDPLTKQIQDMANAVKELPFKEIVKGLQDSQREIDSNAKAYDRATAAVDAQQAIVDKLTAARDRQQKALDREQRKLDAINSTYQKVADTISAVTDAMSAMTDAANNIAGAKDKGAGDNLLGGVGKLPTAGGKNVLGRIGGLGDQSDQIEKDTQKQMDKLKDLFGKMDLFGGLKDKFRAIGAWIKKWIWEEPAKWGDWITAQVKRLGPLVWSWIWSGLKNIGGWFSAGWNFIVDFFKSIPGRLLRLLKSLPHLLITLGKKLIYGLGYGIGFALGMIYRILTEAPGAILDIFIGAGKLLYFVGKEIIIGLGKGLWWALKQIGTFFSNLPGWIAAFFAAAPRWLFNAGNTVLAGLWHGIVAGAEAVWNWFTDLPGRIAGFVAGAPGWLFDVGKDILKGLLNGIVWFAKVIWHGIEDFISGLINGFKDALGIHSPSTIFLGIGKDIMLGLWHGILAIFSTIWGWIKALPGLILRGLGNLANLLYHAGWDLLHGMWNGITAVASTVWNFFTSLPGRIAGFFLKAGSWLLNAGKSIGQGLIDGVTTALKFLAKIFGTPIYWAVKYAINPIITGLNYIPGVDISSIDADSIPHFRRGGKVPGNHNRDDVPIYATPGELVVPKWITRAFGGAEKLMEILGFHGKKGGPGSHFVGGGIPITTDKGSDWAKGLPAAISSRGGSNIVGGLFDWVGNEVDSVTKLLREGAGKVFEATIANPIKTFDNKLDHFGDFGVMLDHAIDSKVDAVVKWIYGKETIDAKRQKDIDSAGVVGNHKGLIDIALLYARQAIDALNESIVNTVVSYESGWNPKAINLTDSNAKAGHPSQGLMQTIPSTFAAYRLPNLSPDITNPLSNLVAGIRYAVARYGSLQQIPGILALLHGQKYIGYDAGGLLPPGVSSVINNTGKPEVIAPQKTFDQIFNRLSDKLTSVDRAWDKLNVVLGSGQGGSVTNNVTNYNTTNVTLTGDLVFPNVESGDDAEEFITNLESLVRK